VSPWSLGGLHGIGGGKAELGREEVMVLWKASQSENVVADGLDLGMRLPFGTYLLLLVLAVRLKKKKKVCANIDQTVNILQNWCESC